MSDLRAHIDLIESALGPAPDAAPVSEDERRRLSDAFETALDAWHETKDRMKEAGPVDFDAPPMRAAKARLEQARQELQAADDGIAQARAARIAALPSDDGSDDGVRSPYNGHYKPRGGFTPEKIRKHLRGTPSLSSKASLSNLYDDKGRSTVFAKEIRKFGSAEEFGRHLFFHGTGGYVSGGLRPGSVLPKNTVLGGGYGEAYSLISLSKSKDIASNFTGESRSGNVHPVLLRKGAKVVARPDLSDSQELEDLLPSLWTRGIDAVKVGDWSEPHSEQELCVVNPNAVVVGRGEYFSVFNKTKFAEPTEDEIAAAYRAACNPPPKPEAAAPAA